MQGMSDRQWEELNRAELNRADSQPEVLGELLVSAYLAEVAAQKLEDKQNAEAEAKLALS